MTIKLSEVISVLESGSRPKGGVKEGQEGIPSLGGEHLSKEGGFNFSKLKMITHEFYSNMKRGKIEIGDILIVKDGATTGKVAIVREDFPFKEAAINEHLFRIRVDSDKAVQEYIFRYLQSPLGQLQILSSFRGAAIGGINTSFVDRVSIDLPPLDEQKRIAAILNKADEIIKSVANHEEVTEKFLDSLFNDSFHSCLNEESNWVPLSEVAEVIDCRHWTPEYIGEGKPILRNSDIVGGELLLERCKLISQKDFDYMTSDGRLPQPNDLLFSRNASVGKSILLSDQEFALGQDLVLIRSDTIDSRFLWKFFLSQHFMRQVNRMLTGSTFKRIDLKKLRNMNVPAPSQIEVANFNSAFKLYQNLKSKRKTDLNNLFLSITQEMLT